MKATKYIVQVEKTDTGFSAFTEEYPVFTTGKNISELIENISEALELYFEEENIKVKPSQIELTIDIQTFFKYFRVINAKYLAERIGMNPTLFSQYVQGRKKPSSSQTRKILDGINEIGKELIQFKMIA